MLEATMKLDVLPLSLAGVMLIRSTRISDSRGSFAETYVKGDFAKSGIPNDFVQDNQSVSISAGTVRGLHFQTPPFQQAKLIRVLRGRIYDVVVDLRRSAATYGTHIDVDYVRFHQVNATITGSFRANRIALQDSSSTVRIQEGRLHPAPNIFWDGR